MPYIPRFKICCIGSVEEARLAVSHGAAALGLVARMPSGPGVISEELIAEIARRIPPGIGSFLLTSHQDTAAIIEQHGRCRTNVIQLTDRIETGSYEDFRRALAGVKIVQVIHVRDETSLAEAEAVAPRVDAILLDSGNQALAIKELGGTGRTHDWRLSRRIRERVGIPLYLAGGLNPGNVREAIAAVRPFGADVCSGVRTKSRLDEEKLRKFREGVRAASRWFR